MAYADGNIIIGTSVDVGGMNTGLYKIQKAMKRLGAIATVGLGAGLYKLSKAAVNAASDLQEIQNVVDVAFKDMSYKIEEFSKVCIKAFGMSELSAKQTAGSFMAMGTSIGITREAASEMAVELTGLTGDFASFYNISQQYAKVAMSAVYTGETETMKRYGIVLTAANLQEYALSIGIDKKVKAMSAAEKTLLRYNYIMEATNNMHNDFERTQHSWANTLRVLQENWNALMAAMGAGLIKVFQPIVEVLNIIVQKLLAIIKYINELLGIMSESNEVEFAEEMEDVADALDDAGNKAKTMLAPFDKLNNITSSSTKSAKDDTKVLEDLYDRMGLAGYVIDKLKGLQVQVEEISEATKLKLRQLVLFFKKAVARIKQIWSNIKLGNWFSVGKDIGDTIATLQQFLSDAIAGVNWTDVGTQVGRFFEGIIWTDALGGWVDVMIAALDGAVDLAVAGIKQISINDIIKLASNVSKAALKIFKWFRRVLKKVDWYDLGKKVGTFFTNIDWGSLLKEAAGMIWDALLAVLGSYTGILNANPIATTLITAIGAALVAARVTGLTDSLTRLLKKSIIKWKRSDLKTQIIPRFKKALGGIAIASSVVLSIGIKTQIAEGEKDFGLGTFVEELVSSALLAAGLSAFISTPWAVAVGAIALVANLIIDYAIQPTDAEKEGKLQAEALEKLRNTKWFSEIEQPYEVLVKLGVNVEAEVTNADAADEYYRNLLNRWLELSSRADELTSDEKNVMKWLAEEVKTYYPDLEKNINKVTGAYEGTADAIQLILDKQHEVMALNVYQNIIEEYTKKITEATVAQNDAREKLEEFNTKLGSLKDSGVLKDYFAELYNEDKIKEMMQTYVDYYDWAEKQIIEGGMWEGWSKERLEEGLKNIDGVIEQLTNESIDKVIQAIETGQSQIKLVDRPVIDLTELMFDFDDERTDETLFDLGQDITELEKLIANYTHVIDDAYEQQEKYVSEASKLDDKLKMTEVLAKISEVNDGMVKAFDLDKKWSEQVDSEILNVKKAMDSGDSKLIEPAVLSLFNTLETGLSGLPNGQMKSDVIATIQNLDSAIRFESKGPVSAISSLATDMEKSYKKSIEDGNEEYVNKPLKETFIDHIKTKTPEWNKWYKETGKDLGKSFGEGYAEGIKEKKKDIEKSAKDMVDAAAKSTAEEQDSHSPSKVAEKLGGYFSSGYASGLLDNISDIEKASQAMIDATVDEFKDVKIQPTFGLASMFDTSSIKVPDIVKGLVIPASMEITQHNENTVAGMSKKDLQSMIYEAVKDISFKTIFEVQGDPYHMFKVFKKQENIYNNRTAHN